MEIWDAYLEDGTLAHKDLIRGEAIPNGYYHLVCEVLVRHIDGDYLLMQRDFAKPNYGGFYEATAGGAALKGENPITCVKRELKEETGISADSFEQIGQLTSFATIFYSYLCITDCVKDSIILQEGETISYKWVSEEEFKEFVNSRKMVDTQKVRYLDYLYKIGYVEDRRMRETRDLILDMAKPEDWESMYRNLWSHDESAKYMLWSPTYSGEDARIRIRKSIEFQKKTPLVYFIYEKESGQGIGFAGMTEIAEHVYEDTGIALGPDFVRKGYGRQVLMELVHQAFDELGAEKFVASCRSGNYASRQLQLACGFTFSHKEDRIDPRDQQRYVLEFYELRKQSGAFCYPDYNHCIANLPNSILKHFHVEISERKTLEAADMLLQKDYKNVVVLLLDGMGKCIMDRNLEPDGFLASHLVETYSSVFPPTTVAATTSILSGLEPVEHSWLGWNCYFKQINKNVTVFLNTESGTDIPAADYHVGHQYCAYESIVEKICHAGGNAYYAIPFMDPYPQTFSEICDRIETLCKSNEKKYIYSYWMEPDHCMHETGCYSQASKQLLQNIEQQVEKLSEKLEDTLLIVTADHGHMDSKNVVITDYPKIMECLERLPSIESRALSLFVKKGMEKQFKTEFNREFGDQFKLWTKQEVKELQLFGS